jgi:aryl-alcohol dehydrogenase-like predicted oxidoreductase
MKTTELGRTGITISRLGFGAWAAGGGSWAFGWSNQDDSDSLAAIDRALERGITWIDTAAGYGFGHSEEIVGRAIAGSGHARPLLFTKCGALDGGAGQIVFDLDPGSIRRELEASLGRLGVEAIDLYQIHRPLPEPDLERGWKALVQLREEGLVRCIGVSNFTVGQLERIGEVAPVQTIQPPYSLMQPEAGNDLLTYAERAGIGVIVYSPMGSGLLTGTMTPERLASLPESDWRRRDKRFSPAALARSIELVPRLREVGRRHAASPGEVAIAWALHHPAVDGAIVGFRNADQVDGVFEAAALELSDADLDVIAGRAGHDA